MSVLSKEMFMRFDKFSISRSLPGLLDRLRKCCAKAHCRFLAVYSSVNSNHHFMTGTTD